ncbi:MAG TPA: PQQ-binding-like beta-propeller repeat protein [Caulobacteraceae bacterium]|nr:PQQ-binding-like beta-propeller repeat protein [Caulobacteraceae bacterium]
MQKSRVRLRALAVAGWVLVAAAPFVAASGLGARATAEGAAPPPAATSSNLAEGEALFKARCASCHEPAVGRAPDRAALSRLGLMEVLNTLLNGAMRPMAQGLTTRQLGLIANYVSPPTKAAAASPPPDPPRCAKIAPFKPAPGDWPVWGQDLANRRQTSAGPPASQASRLNVKWAFALAGGKEGEPTVAGGRVFLTSFSGNAYALDAAVGCLIWRIDGAHSRTAMTVAPLAAAPSGWAVFYGDQTKSVHAVDAADGKAIWAQRVEDHPLAILTGAPAVWGGRVYQPISSFEELTASAATYPCCTFRGSVAALDAATGKLLWKTPAISQPPAPSHKNAAGTQMFGPAGAAIWSTPTIDAKRGVLYVATGDSYTDVKEDGSDSILAIDLATGKVKWRTQVTAGDNYLSGCEVTPLVNCPKSLGHDFDFGAPPVLARTAGGADILLAGQKSGAAYGLDPADGHVLWKTQVGAGGPLGGVEWGMASDGRRLYVGVADAFMPSPPGRPGLAALDPATGHELWSTPSPRLPCGWTGGAPCLNGISAAPTISGGLVYAGDMNGRLRAYDASSGKVVWEVDTGAGTFATVNGVAAAGGNIDGAGPVAAYGRLYMMSGYQGSLGGPTTSVLVVYSVDGQ